MKRTRWILVLLLSAVLLLTLTACGEPEPEVSVSVTLVNRSGCDISSISITPSTSTEWDTEYVDGVFADGESIEAVQLRLDLEICHLVPLFDSICICTVAILDQKIRCLCDG